jgi:hypothetical protein
LSGFSPRRAITFFYLSTVHGGQTVLKGAKLVVGFINTLFGLEKDLNPEIP